MAVCSIVSRFLLKPFKFIWVHFVHALFQAAAGAIFLSEMKHHQVFQNGLAPPFLNIRVNACKFGMNFYSFNYSDIGNRLLSSAFTSGG